MYAFSLENIEDQDRFEDSSFFDIKCQPAWYGLPPRTDLPHQQQLSDDDDLIDNSFEQLSNQHPQAIEDAFVDFKNANLIERETENFGLHELQLKKFAQIFSEEQKTLKEVINTNKLLSQKDREQFLKDLKKDTILSQTVKGLIPVFDEEALGEAVFLIQRAWEKYLTFQKNFIIKKPVIPMFKRIYDFDSFTECQQEVSRFNIPKRRLQKESKRVAELFKDRFFQDSRIKILNLRSASQKVTNENKQIEGFLKFLKVLCKAVFLSAEGEFEHPQQRNEQELAKRTRSCRFAESFSQDQQESESDEEKSIRCQASKKRKLY